MFIDLKIKSLDKVVSDERHDLFILGKYWFEQEKMLKIMEQPDILEKDISYVEMDGDYLLYYNNKQTGYKLVYNSHINSRNIYYLLDNDKCIISDDLFYLLQIKKQYTWNSEALTDYFEVGWNNISKEGKTPFEEIHTLQGRQYIELVDGKLNFNTIHKKEVNTIERNKYTLSNLNEFKDDFIKMIYSKLDCLHILIKSNIDFTISGGIDSNSLACCNHFRYPEDNNNYYTTNFGDEDDESYYAEKMERIVGKKIKKLYIDIPKDFLDELKSIISITQLPYSDIEGLTHYCFFEKMAAKGAKAVITGFGADLTFGGTPGEYFFWSRDMFKKGKIKKSYMIYKAACLADGAEVKEGFRCLINFMASQIPKGLKKLIWRIKGVDYNKENEIKKLLNVNILPFKSEKIQSYKERLQYAMTDSGLRQLSALQRSWGIEPYTVFESDAFSELADKCDPYIFVYKENKHCIREAMKGILPNEILENKRKYGNGGYNIPIWEKNKIEVLKYLQEATSDLVNIQALYNEIKKENYSDNVFRCLNLVLYEEIVSKYTHAIIKPE